MGSQLLPIVFFQGVAYDPGLMPTLPCPACGKLAARVPDDPGEALGNHYTCAHCGHTWVTARNSTTVLKHITPLTRTPASRE